MLGQQASEEEERQSSAKEWRRKKGEAHVSTSTAGVKPRQRPGGRVMVTAVAAESVAASGKGEGKKKRRKSKQESDESESAPSSSMGYFAKVRGSRASQHSCRCLRAMRFHQLLVLHGLS